MATKGNNWRGLLKQANEELEGKGRALWLDNSTGFYALKIKYGDGSVEEYAEGYYESELPDLIADAWKHANQYAKAAKHRPNKKKYVAVPFMLLHQMTTLIDSYEARNPFPVGNPNRQRIIDVCDSIHKSSFKILTDDELQTKK